MVRLSLRIRIVPGIFLLPVTAASFNHHQERLSSPVMSSRCQIREAMFTLQPPGNLIPVDSQIGLRSELGLGGGTAMRHSTGRGSQLTRNTSDLSKWAGEARSQLLPLLWRTSKLC